jgi:hypothetical protein
MTPPDLNAIVDRLAGPAILRVVRELMERGFSRELMNAEIFPQLVPAFELIREKTLADVRAVVERGAKAAATDFAAVSPTVGYQPRRSRS